jgi:hypothetical protein
MEKMVLIWSLLWNFGPYFPKIESQTANLFKSSINIDFSLGVTIGVLYLSILPLWQFYDRFNISLQTKPNVISCWNGAVKFLEFWSLFSKIESGMGYGVLRLVLGPYLWSLLGPFFVKIWSLFRSL